MRRTVPTADDLRVERARARVSQRALAAELGMARQGLSAIETGAMGQTVTAEFAARYMEALGRITPDARIALTPRKAS